MKFGEFLKKQRDVMEWTQPDAAASIGIEQSYLSKLENNKAIPSTEMFDKLMETYNFNLNQISEHVSDSELVKLKEIVLIRDFIITNKKQNESTRRHWLVASLISSMLGVALMTYGILMEDNVNINYIYESKGVVLQNEPSFVFSELPNYQMFLGLMQIQHQREKLKKLPLFKRLDYIQINQTSFKGNFFDTDVEKGKRRYFLIDDVRESQKMPFYLGATFGAMFIMGGLGALFMSRKW